MSQSLYYPSNLLKVFYKEPIFYQIGKHELVTIKNGYTLIFLKMSFTDICIKYTGITDQREGDVFLSEQKIY